MRERKMMVSERVRETNRIRGLLASQGIADYNPLRRNRRDRLETLRTGDSRPLPEPFKAEISRALDRIELVERQLRELEAERNALVEPTSESSIPGTRLLAVRGIGPEFAAVLSLECFFRHFDNRRHLAAYAGLAPSPWQSGRVDHIQGVSKAGNTRLRTAMSNLSGYGFAINLARPWPRGSGSGSGLSGAGSVASRSWRSRANSWLPYGATSPADWGRRVPC